MTSARVISGDLKMAAISRKCSRINVGLYLTACANAVYEIPMIAIPIPTHVCLSQATQLGPNTVGDYAEHEIKDGDY